MRDVLNFLVVLTVAASTKDLPSVVLDHWLHDRSDTYIFDSLHFHFGGNDSVGSEHLINEKRYSMEVSGIQ